MNATDNSTNNTATASNIVDKTNKNNISVLYVDGYYRVGPFRWEFDGKLNGIEVTGDNGKISESNVRIARYRGSVPSIIDASDLGSGEDFYIDVKASIELKK